MADNKILIEVSVAGNAEVQFKKLSDSVSQFGVEAKKTFFDAGRFFDNFIANLASSAVTSAINLFSAGFSEINDVLKDSIAAASEQEDAINRLNAALKTSGQFSQAASEELQAFATGLQSTTKYADETILSATSLISSLSQLDKEGLKKATQAALDLSAALGIDLESAARLVGKAADGEVGSLKRYGVQVKDTGDKTRDFATALDAINSKFGGSAAAQVNTFSGAMAVLKNQYGEVLETIGETITKSPAVVETFKKLGEMVDQVNGFFKNNKSVLDDFVSKGMVFVIESVNVAVSVFRDLGVFVLQTAQVFLKAQQYLSSFTDKVTLGLTDAGERAKKSAADILELDAAIKSLQENVVLNSITTSTIELTNAIRDRTEASKESMAVDQEIAVTKSAMAQDEVITQIAFYENSLLNQETAQSNALASYANSLLARNAALQKANTDEAKQQIAANNTRIQQILGSNQLEGQKKIELKEKVAEAERQIEMQRAREQLDTLGRIATLSTAKTKELAIVGKTAAIALATIDTYKGANSALAVVPFPFNFAAAAAVIAAGLVNVSNIVGTPLATGITEVPAGFQNDTFPARLSSGERVVSAPQNRDLTEFLAGSTGLTSKLDQLIAVLGQNGGRTVVNIGGREVLGAIQDELDSGRNLIV